MYYYISGYLLPIRGNLYHFLEREWTFDIDYNYFTEKWLIFQILQNGSIIKLDTGGVVQGIHDMPFNYPLFYYKRFYNDVEIVE